MIKKVIFRIIKLIFNFYYQYQYQDFRNKYQISSNFIFNGNEIFFYGDGEIICGNNSYIGRYSSIQSGVGQVVKIGQKTSISHNVRIYTNSANADQNFIFKGSDSFKEVCGDVNIGDSVWIGANVFITEGVSIGDNCVVGANAVVNRSLPPHSICAGVPAKVIKFKSYLTDSEISDYIKLYSSAITQKVLQEHGE